MIEQIRYDLYDRRAHRLEFEIEYDERISLAAQMWASNNRNNSQNGYYKPNYRNYAQYTWGLYSEDTFIAEFDLEASGMNIWWDFHDRPYTSWPYGLDRETEEQWKMTTKFGVGCSTYRHPGGSWNFILIIFFNLFDA